MCICVLQIDKIQAEINDTAKERLETMKLMKNDADGQKEESGAGERRRSSASAAEFSRLDDRLQVEIPLPIFFIMIWRTSRNR